MVTNGSIKQCFVSETASLRDALASLDHTSLRVVLLTDARGCAIALLTDGDIRRAMLRGADLADPALPFAIRGFVSVDPRATRAEVLDLMQARRVSEVPVLDKDRRCVALHLMHDVIAHVPRPNWAVVMAGGRGTRLGAITHSVPKPMLRVAGRPILERIVLNLAGAGVNRIFLAINYLGHIVEEHFGNGDRFGCRVDYLREEKALGTAGALSLLPESPDHSLVVVNGDLITQVDFGDMIEFHNRLRQAITVGVRWYEHVVPFGCFELEGSAIVAVTEKPTLSKVINAGIYVVQPRLLSLVPQNEPSTMPELLERAIAGGESVGAYEIDDDWIDVGRREQLRQARGETP